VYGFVFVLIIAFNDAIVRSRKKYRLIKLKDDQEVGAMLRRMSKMTNQEKHKDKSPLILQKIFDDFCEKQ
jgi:hypothetical protein